MKRSLKTFLAILLIFSLAFSLLTAGCSKPEEAKVEKEEKEQEQQKAEEKTEIKVVDAYGRTVELKEPVKRVVAIGPGALRLVCYLKAQDMVVGIENMEKMQQGGRPYIMANPELLKLPVIGQGGPNSQPDLEKIVSVNPDIIFASFIVDAKMADEIQQKTGIPVFIISYGKVGVFDETLFNTLEGMGKVLGREERAKEVIDFIKKCNDDLYARTHSVSENERPSVYVGALGFKGMHGIESSQGKFYIFEAVNARNVVDETGKEGSVMVDKEKILAWNPDYIFIDEGGLNLVKQDYAKNRQYYMSLKAFREGKVYGMLPFNYYWTNVETALANAYWVGKVLYPERFKDVDPVKKADEIYEFFTGRKLYSEMEKQYGGFTRLTF